MEDNNKVEIDDRVEVDAVIEDEDGQADSVEAGNENAQSEEPKVSDDTVTGDSKEDTDKVVNDGNGPDKKEHFFKKQKKDKKDIQIEELTDRLKRTMAEFDNFRKRTEKEKSTMYEIGAKDILEKILPIVDNFERGFGAAAQGELESPFGDGMNKIYKQFIKTLEDVGVKPIEALEKEFNPDFHNAVMHIEDENYGENIIIEEFQKGYTYKDSVIRHSMVKVAN